MEIYNFTPHVKVLIMFLSLFTGLREVVEVQVNLVTTVFLKKSALLDLVYFLPLFPLFSNANLTL